MEKGFLNQLLRLDQTVFTFKDLLLQWNGIDVTTARKRVNYYVKSGYLYAIRRGFYAKDNNYDRLELGARIYTPSYISFETVLGNAGVTFQHYSQIFLASYQSRQIIVDGQNYVYKTIKSEYLTNSAGITNKGAYSIAIPERAFLDVVYINNNYHFDHLGSLDWQKVFKLLPIYKENKSVASRVNWYYQSLQA